MLLKNNNHDINWDDALTYGTVVKMLLSKFPIVNTVVSLETLNEPFWKS